MPLVSVIIPNYNKGGFIIESLESVINQTFQDWECIIIDDGSTDNSVQIIKDFIKTDTRFLFFERETLPKGGSVCRNLGLKIANGNWVVFFDSDDLMTTDFLSQRVTEIEKNPNLDFAVFTNGTFLKNIGDMDNTWRPPLKNHLKKFLSFDLPWNVMSPIWNKKFISSLSGFDINYPMLQDVELHTRALLSEGVRYKVFADAKPCCFYRISAERKKNSIAAQQQLHLDGLVMYLDNMVSLLQRQHKSGIIKYLRGAVFSMVTRLQWLLTQNSLSKEEANKLLNNINEVTTKRAGIFKRAQQLTLTLYIKLYHYRFYKIKGFNFLFKKLYINDWFSI